MPLSQALTRLAAGTPHPPSEYVVQAECRRIASRFGSDAWRAGTTVDDVAQDVAISLIQTVRGGTNPPKPYGYVRAMCLNRIIDLARETKRRQRGVSRLKREIRAARPTSELIYFDPDQAEERRLLRLRAEMERELAAAAREAFLQRRTPREASSFWLAWRQNHAVAFGDTDLSTVLEQTTGVPRTDPGFEALRVRTWQACRRARETVRKAAWWRAETGACTRQQAELVDKALDAMKNTRKSPAATSACQVSA